MARPVPAGAKFINVPQLCDRWGGISTMTIERKLKDDPNFPRPRRLGRLRVFDIPEIETYERGLVVKQTRKSA
jgi:predicted DNA-binding transcriptional regulator AlpA